MESCSLANIFLFSAKSIIKPAYKVDNERSYEVRGWRFSEHHQYEYDHFSETVSHDQQSIKKLG